MSFTKEERETLRALYDEVRTKGAFPTVEEFKARFGEEALINLGERGFLWTAVGRVQLRWRGLRNVGTPEAEQDVAKVVEVISALQAVARHQSEDLFLSQAVEAFSLDPNAAARQLTFIDELLRNDAVISRSTGLATTLFVPAVIEVMPARLAPAVEELIDPSPPEDITPRIDHIIIDGYRALDQFSGHLSPLTVIIGANAVGKSSLFDLLRFVAFAAIAPLPPEIDPGSAGRTLFHGGAAEAINVVLRVTLKQRLPLLYHVEIRGPIGAPSVSIEHLTGGWHKGAEDDNYLMRFDTHRQVRRLSERHGEWFWEVPANELTLRRALDPTLVTASAFQRYLSSFRFYEGFDTGPRSPIRRPVMSEPAPILAADGSNLSAVLFWLMTEHREAWEELELRLRTAVPGFQALGVKPRGGPGTVLGVWREDGVPGELTLADLSDGTLLLLCWAALCLSPTPPPLVCIDEPEIGLHPRVLPVLASLLRTLSTRTQVLVATHSPYLVSQFDLEQIAVMKKEDGKAVFRRPADQAALRREIEELGGEEIARMHISDELEARS